MSVVLDKGTIKRIHINGALLRKHLTAAKPISIRNRGRVLRAGRVDIVGDSTLVYSPKKPLSSGAVLWIETRGEVWYS